MIPYADSSVLCPTKNFPVATATVVVVVVSVKLLFRISILDYFCFLLPLAFLCSRLWCVWFGRFKLMTTLLNNETEHAPEKLFLNKTESRERKKTHIITSNGNSQGAYKRRRRQKDEIETERKRERGRERNVPPTHRYTRTRKPEVFVFPNIFFLVSLAFHGRSQ